MRTNLKLTAGILLVAFAIIGAKYLIPHNPGSPVSSKKQLYLIIGVLALSFLGGFYFVFQSLKKINSR